MNILILRPDNIGDVVLFSGAIQHIRNRYPEAHITLAVQAHIINLVELCPYIDALVPVEQVTWWGRGGRTYFPLKHRFKMAIHHMNRVWNAIRKPYDSIIYPLKSPSVSHLEILSALHSEQTYGIIGCYLCAPKTGFPPELHPVKLFTHHYDVSKINPWQHESLVTLEFLRFLGCCVTTVGELKPQFWLSGSEHNYLDMVKKNGKKIIGIFPGASSEGRQWGVDNYGELSRLLGGPLIYAIFGGPADMDLVNRVSHLIKEGSKDAKVLNLAGRTSLRELVVSISSCDLFIGMDTSGLHMAIATDVPTIGIVGGGHFGRFVPWGDPETNIFLTYKMECFNCNWRCGTNMECVRNVSPHEVADAVKKLLIVDLSKRSA
ncbi:MAG: glycosyltransferase family 9 protein [Geobacteraceae bacterium]|nr:glycosyltransferase family 9 protein [Geobacteraceae bacterium]NTW80176.1 glycosyltransferase family 9 protein [Geobacteraceae bacterium]